jgi:hypothetical protein
VTWRRQYQILRDQKPVTPLETAIDSHKDMKANCSEAVRGLTRRILERMQKLARDPGRMERVQVLLQVRKIHSPNANLCKQMPCTS